MSGEINGFLKAGVFLLAAITFALALAPGEVKAQSTFNVSVNVSATSQITVIPTLLTWTQIGPGKNGAVQNVSIKNTGSLNISTLEVSANTITLEASNPLGSGDPLKYAAPGFILVQNATSGAPYYHLGRLEWNMTGGLLASEVLPASPQAVWSHGWYRNASGGASANGNDYLWILQFGTAGRCNETGTSFIIKKLPENSTSMQRDLSTGVTTGNNCGTGGTYTNQTGKDWGVFYCGAEAGNPLAGQYVAVYYDCSKIYIYNYDRSNSAFPSTVTPPYLWNTVLTPGSETYMNAIASVPLGTPAGTTTQGTVTITAA